MASDVRIRAERDDDRTAVLSVVSCAFVAEPGVVDLWNALAGRTGTTGYVGELDDAIVGHVGLSWGWVDAPERLVDVLVLSPLCVAPEHQRAGIGRALVAHAIRSATELGAPVLFLEGDPAYYSRLGFGPAASHGFTPPSTRIPLPAFQCVLLPAYEPTVSGALVYPDTFWAHDAVGLRGDQLTAVERALGVARSD